MDETIGQRDERIEIRVIETLEGCSEHSEAWDDLFARANGASPYLSRQWVSVFIQEERLRGGPALLLAWHGEELVALLPLAIRQFLGTKIAEPIGTGEPSYLGLLLDPDHPEAVERMVETIRTRRIFRVFCIEDLWSEDNATAQLLTKLADAGFSVRRVYRNPCPLIKLPCSYEEYIRNTKSPKSRQTLLRKERRLHSKHTVDIESYSGPEITEGILSRVASIQERSWMRRRGAAILGRAFYQKLLLSMANAGLASVWLMTIDDADAAFVFALVAHKRLIYGWTAFDLKYTSSLSIGQFLTSRTIQQACSDGIESYDFLHGDAQYKRFWSTDCPSVQRAVAGRGLGGRLIALACFALWRLKRMKTLRSFRNRIRKMLHALRQNQTVT